MASQYILRLTLSYAQVAQAELRQAQECSPSAQVKAAAAHVHTLKRNQRKKKLSLTYVVALMLKVASFEPIPNEAKAGFG
jgi:hypothetical protein